MLNTVTLTTKIQYKDFEPGEFVEEEKRSYEETVKLIENFPWEKERDKLIVSLTNSSVTINDEDGCFLKLALFYNGKFVLHYFDTSQQLFTKSFVRFPDAFPYIKNFFEKTFVLDDFRKENTWLQQNQLHFFSQSFNYTLTPAAIRRYLFKTSGLNFGLTLFIALTFLFHQGRPMPWFVPVILLPYTFLIGGGINLILFFNYLQLCKNKVLIMSKGNDIFYYGNKLNPVKYNKCDIIQAIMIEANSNRNSAAFFSVVKLELKTGFNIIIPNLLVNEGAMKSKLFMCPKIEQHKFPYIKASAFTI